MDCQPSAADGDVSVERRRPSSRGPYVTGTGKSRHGPQRPSEVLAANLRAYRLLRHMTQDQLAARMADLCHGWGRSTVSAVEGKSRNVTIDELFGLAVSVGVTIGQLLDPTGPDQSRRLGLDVGLRAPDSERPQPIAPRLAQLWARSCAVIRLPQDQDGKDELHIGDEAAPLPSLPPP